MTLQDEPSRAKGPVWPDQRGAGQDRSWIGGAVVVAVAALAAIAILSADWHRTRTTNEFLPPESRRPMMMAPLPR